MRGRVLRPVALAARAGTLLVWVGEAGVRLYAAGQPGGARADRLLWRARLALDEGARLKVVRKMFELRFNEPAPERRSVDQLRGIEGAWVKDHVVNIKDGQITSWQVNLEVTFVLDDSGAPVDASSD